MRNASRGSEVRLGEKGGWEQPPRPQKQRKKRKESSSSTMTAIIYKRRNGIMNGKGLQE